MKARVGYRLTQRRLNLGEIDGLELLAGVTRTPLLEQRLGEIVARTRVAAVDTQRGCIILRRVRQFSGAILRGAATDPGHRLGWPAFDSRIEHEQRILGTCAVFEICGRLQVK